MLVLSRTQRQNENTLRYYVPPSDHETIIDVIVNTVRGSKVRIGSEAPKQVRVVRLEVDGKDAA